MDANTDSVFPNSAKIKINGKNIYLSHSFRDFNDVQIIFGASNLGRFFFWRCSTNVYKKSFSSISSRKNFFIIGS